MSELQASSEPKVSDKESLPAFQERQEKGRDLRKEVPRSSHKSLGPMHDRPDPVNLLQKHDEKRLKKLLPIKYGRMLKSPFAFFRGTADIMAYDLAKTPVTGLQAQLCGDAHLLNFGIFATPERKLVFDINDFDETHPGPWEWDLKRLATSAILAGRDKGFEEKINRKLAKAVAAYYRKAMSDFASAAFLDVWYYQVEVDELLRIFEKFSRRIEKQAQNIARNARNNTQSQSIQKLTEVIEGRRWIVSNPPLVVRLTEIMSKEDKAWITKEKYAEKLFKDYVDSVPEEKRQLLLHFNITDGALRVGGIGSIGTRCLIFLLEGAAEDEALILQLKEAEQSVLEPYVEKKNYTNQAQRVVSGQKLIQGASDIFLGWHESPITGTAYYWRQLKDMKGSFDLVSMDETSLETYLKVCSVCLARAHARTGDAASISGYIGKSETFCNAITDFAQAYADWAERDFEIFREAVKAGRIEVREGI